jgi:hypothetical protein
MCSSAGTVTVYELDSRESILGRNNNGNRGLCGRGVKLNFRLVPRSKVVGLYLHPHTFS